MGRPKKIKPDAEQVAEQAEQVHAWNSEADVAGFLASLIKMTGARTAIEIGVFEGRTSKAMIEALPHGGRFIGIDIEDLRSDAGKAAYESTNVSCDFFVGSSMNALKVVPQHYFDVVFVDGDHSWDYVIKEFKLVEHLITRNGLIVYHDTIHLEGPRNLVEYAAHYGYKNVTLNTPELRGLSILHR